MIDTVLLIDDDKATNFINKRIVSLHDKVNNVHTVQGGNEALEYLKSIDINGSNKPQLVFLDLNMPLMNGWEFIEEYMHLDPKITNEIKLVILTSSADPNDVKRSKKIDSVSDFINKPLTKESFKKVLGTHFIEVV